MACRLLLLLLALASLSGCCRGIWYSRGGCDAGDVLRPATESAFA